MKIQHHTIRLLLLLRDTRITQKEYAQYLGWNRQKVGYEIGKLRKCNMISRIKKTQFYRPTITGVNVLDQYESTEKKYEIGIENARWKVWIANDKLLQKFLFQNDFTINTKLNNWTQWNGKIDGFVFQINFGKRISMVIQHPTVYGGNFLDQTNKAEARINLILGNLNKKWNFKLGIPEMIDTLQFTINDPIAEHIMEQTGGSQVKIGKLVSFDQSFGSEPRTEFGNINDAINWSLIPKMFSESLKLLKDNRDDWKIMKEVMPMMLEHQKDTSESIKEIRDILANAFGKKPEEKLNEKSLDKDTSRMFG